MLIHIKHLKTGQEVIVDNTGEIQGKVKVTGPEIIREAISNFLNKDIQIRYKDQLEHLSSILPSACIIKNSNSIYEVYKASDLYLTEYFIPKFCSLHGYEVVTSNFNG